MKKLRLLAIFVAAISWTTFANNELNPPKPANIPTALLVRIDPAGNAVTYKINSPDRPTNDREAQALLKASVNESQRIKTADAATSELDRSSSQPAWFHFGYGWGWRGYPGYYPAYGYGGPYGYPYYGMGYYCGYGACGYPNPYYYSPYYAFSWGGWNNYFYWY